MSSEAAAAEEMMCCANCGISAIDDVKLKDCNGGCDLVKYCSGDCQEDHKDNHGEERKKRMIELRDNDLFTPPEGSHLGECPICCLPLSIVASKSTFMGCCSKSICIGCEYANTEREREAGLRQRCAFCREPTTKSKEEWNKIIMKRIKKNCPAAMCHIGATRYNEGDYEEGLEYLTKAAELGDAEAHYVLSVMYYKGEGVEKDIKKQVYHLEQAAIGGHPFARNNLGVEEVNNGRYERARKHWIIAANLGHHNSLEGLRRLYADGHASKEEYANALRAYQAAVDERKSAEREKAEEAIKNGLW
jgi:tetratricopeptide (TPR) repeat protein